MGHSAGEIVPVFPLPTDHMHVYASCDCGKYKYVCVICATVYVCLRIVCVHVLYVHVCCFGVFVCDLFVLICILQITKATIEEFHVNWALHNY